MSKFENSCKLSCIDYTLCFVQAIGVKQTCIYHAKFLNQTFADVAPFKWCLVVMSFLNNTLVRTGMQTVCKTQPTVI